MEADQNFKKEYDEILAIYSKRKAENTNAIKSITQLESKVANLESELSKYDSNPSEETGANERLEIAALTSKVHEYQQLIKQVEEDIKNDKVAFSSQVSRLNSQHHHHHGHSQVVSGVEDEELTHLNHQIAQVQKTIKEEDESIRQAQIEQHNNQELLAKLEAELQKLNEAQRLLGTVGPDAHSNTALETELKEYEKTLSTLQNELKDENSHKKNEKEKLEASLKTAKSALAKQQAGIEDKKSKRKSLETQLVSDGNEKLNQLQAQVKRLQTKNAQIQKEIDTLAQTVQVKKAQKAAHQQQLKKYKEKKERNYKLQIMEAEKNQEILKKEMEREKQKLSDILKLSKSYVSQENLQILQKELARHQAASSRVNVEAEDSKKAKHIKENEVLKSRIQYLRTSSRNLEQQTENIVKQLKKAGDQLVKEKLAQEKVFNHTNNKLNEYMKEFPDHEKKKEAQKLEEKRRKAEEREKIREAAREEREKRKQQDLKLKTANEPEVVEGQNNNLPAWQKWDKWELKNLPAKDETSIFNNRQFQLATGAVALLSILFLVFG